MPNHPRLNNNEQILVKRNTIETLESYLHTEVYATDTPAGQLQDHLDELTHAQTRADTPGFYDGDLVISPHAADSQPDKLWRITGCTHTERLDGTPTVIYHAENPENPDHTTSLDADDLTAAENHTDPYTTPSQ